MKNIDEIYTDDWPSNLNKNVVFSEINCVKTVYPNIRRKLSKEDSIGEETCISIYLSSYFVTQITPLF